MNSDALTVPTLVDPAGRNAQPRIGMRWETDGATEVSWDAELNDSDSALRAAASIRF